MMKKIAIFLALLVLFISIGAVSAEGNFTALQEEIDSSTDSIEITQNYVYDNTTDYKLNAGIKINQSNFVINGNGNTIDASNQTRIFVISGHNVTINNLNLINGNKVGKNGGAIWTNGSVILNNITFTNNTAKWGGNIYSSNETKIVNSIFDNSTSNYGAAIFAENKLTIINSTFKDLYANETAGAIGVKQLNHVEINNCTFTNIEARKNGGAIYIDLGDAKDGTTYILNSTFFNTAGDFGGALVQLDGKLYIQDSEFINNTATYNGGAIYISSLEAEITNTQINENKLTSGNYSYGGGIYTDNSYTTIKNCEFINNTMQGIYAYDNKLSVDDTLFSDNGEAIHAVFSDSELNNITFGNDTLFLNDTNYASYVYEMAKSISLINNTINVATLPSRYDSREWGWVSSVKDQGNLGSCWTFGNCGALESALLKATGIEYDFSESNMQNSMLKYSIYGFIGQGEGGIREEGQEYALSWFGMMPTEYDTYDELGKLSPLITGAEKIHIFDTIFVDLRNNSTDNDKLKKAILMCGSVTTGYYHDENSFNEKTYAYYQYSKNSTNHAIGLVGWDDNYSASNFITPPPGDGAFILKNSWGSKFGENGFMYISYYDTSLLNTTFAVGYVIENIENYTANYQTDLGGILNTLKNDGNIISYKNTYESYRPELISAIGTYFEADENYTFEIYVNDKLAHTQSGISPFGGYHTVKLTTEIPITAGDLFTAVMKKASVTRLVGSRQYYKENISFIDWGDGWEDSSNDNVTISLKVYTKDLAIYTKDLVKIYKNDSKFEAEIGIANETVTFEINGRNYTRTSDENGTATMAINLGPGNYTIKTTFNGTTVENTIEVLPTLIADNLVKYFRNASQFYIDLIDGEGNPVNGTNITMNINGVFYNRETNENGTARLNINLIPGEYILTAIDPLTGLMMSYNITVLPTLNATNLEMTYNDNSTFNVTVLDGEGNPLADAKVTFNINGVFYNRYSDSKGIAGLNIRLMAGEYIITSEYDGFKIANTIIIKD